MTSESSRLGRGGRKFTRNDRKQILNWSFGESDTEIERIGHCFARSENIKTTIHSCLSLLHLELKMCHKGSVQYVILSKTDKMFNWYVYWIWQHMIIVLRCWQFVLKLFSNIRLESYSVKSFNLLAMEYKKPKVLVKSRIQLADCSRKGPCGRPSCSSKPSGRH